MSRCWPISIFQEFLGGKLSPEEEGILTEHVQQCRQCELELALLADDPGQRAIARQELPPLDRDQISLEALILRVEVATRLQSLRMSRESGQP